MIRVKRERVPRGRRVREVAENHGLARRREMLGDRQAYAPGPARDDDHARAFPAFRAARPSVARSGRPGQRVIKL